MDNITTHASIIILPLYFVEYENICSKWNIFIFISVILLIILIYLYTDQEKRKQREELSENERKKQEKLTLEENREKKLIKKICKQGYYDIYITFNSITATTNNLFITSPQVLNESIATTLKYNLIANDYGYINLDDCLAESNSEDKSKYYCFSIPLELNKIPGVELRLHIADKIFENKYGNFGIESDWFPKYKNNFSVVTSNVAEISSSIAKKFKLFLLRHKSDLHRMTYYCSNYCNEIDLLMASICNSVVLPQKIKPIKREVIQKKEPKEKINVAEKIKEIENSEKSGNSEKSSNSEKSNDNKVIEKEEDKEEKVLEIKIDMDKEDDLSCELFNLNSSVVNELTKTLLAQNYLGYDYKEFIKIMKDPKLNVLKVYKDKLSELREKQIGKMFSEDIDFGETEINKEICDEIKKMYQKSNVKISLTLKELTTNGFSFRY